MKNFQEMIDNHEYTFPEIVDAATQSLLVDFFGLRYPVRHFDRFFDRDLNLIYPYYQEMLRIDPTSVEVDWFVQNYIEREVKGFHNESSSQDGNATNTQTGSNVNIGYATNQHNGSKYGNTGHVINSSGNSNDQEDVTRTVGTETDTENATSTSDRAMKHLRQNPMSESYTSEQLKALNGKTVQLAGTGGTFSATANAANIAYPKIKNPTASEDGISFHTGVEHDVNKANTNETSGRTLANTHSDNSVDTGTYNDTDVTSDVNNSTNTQTTNNTAQNLQHTNTASEGNNTQREIMTGRNMAPAEVIARAKEAIATTSAYKYLIKSLDRNFKQCYRLEDYV